ncbi:SMI1/KNR4 family protein [Microbispora sp. H10885]|uniref:SMI1/KNR4 family protein n=1 Tax=Microbispora sp. H10885 TaxID=2729110 RepID=UPI0015FF9D55|nr:SMI1/KNR4 family protein [Microbispora sp. H10885]
MIASRWTRVAGPALVTALLTAGLAGEPDPGGNTVTCSYAFGGLVSLSCGDPAIEARIRANALTPEEAKAIDCPPVLWDDDQSAAEILEAQDPAFADDQSTYPLRAPDPAVAARVNRAWDRIERWLAAHASATLRQLKLGADPEDLARWEATHSRRLPDDLYASYLRHDGTEDGSGAGFQLPPSYDLLGLFDIDDRNDSNCRSLVMWGDREGADPEHGKWHGSLLAIGSDGYSRDLFVEPRTGRVGEASWQEKLAYDGPMGWPSHVAMLEALAGALESGQPLRRWYPVVVAGCALRWAEHPVPLRPGCAGGPRPSPSP